MVRRVTIRAGDVAVSAILHDNPTADAVWAALPIVAQAARYGGEIYFDVPALAGLPPEPDARAVVMAGELGYWPQGPGLAIFFGPTAWSQDDEIRAYSPVNVFARLESDPLALEPVPDGASVQVERA